MKLPPGITEQHLCERLDRFQIETPSWGYADTGTRFGKFLQDGAATTVDEKLADAAAVAAHARSLGLRIGSINPNVFQDQRYKLGSVANRDPAIRRLALEHILAGAHLGPVVGSNLLSLWFADGTNYPGQGHIRQRKRWFVDALRAAHDAMPPGMTMLVEYKPFEPAFYHTDIADWGMACLLARHAGPRAKVLVDTGHHLPGCNIEHIVAFLIDEGMLGGFHFNDRKYADDDLTMGSIDPYQLFRIFHEIILAERELGGGADLPVAYTIDQSHNIKPKIEAMIETVVAAQEYFTKAMLVDHARAAAARERDDVVMAERALKDAFATDVRPFLADYRTSRSLPPDPLDAFRQSGYLTRVAAARSARKRESGTSGSSYA